MSTYDITLRRYTVLSQTLLPCIFIGRQANHLCQGSTSIFLGYMKGGPGKLKYRLLYDSLNGVRQNCHRDSDFLTYAHFHQ